MTSSTLRVIGLGAFVLFGQ